MPYSRACSTASEGKAMSGEGIQSRLKALFEQSPVVVWNDAACEFGDALGELDLPGVTILAEREGERFELKALVNDLREGERLLVYRPGERGTGPDWLSDVTCYAPAFAADAMTMRLADLGARDTPEMRAMVRRLAALLRRKRPLGRLRELRDHYDSPRELALAAMVVALGANVPMSEDWVVLAFLREAFEKGAANVCARLDRSGVLDPFRDMLREYVGFTGFVERDDELAVHVLMGALGIVVPEAASLSACDGTAMRHSGEVARLWSQLAQGMGVERDALARAAGVAEDTFGLRALLAACDTATLARVDCLPEADLIVYERVLDELEQGNPLDEQLRGALGHLRTSVWRDRHQALLAMIDAAVEMNAFHREYLGQIRAGCADAAGVWEAYASEWYRMDAAYRRFRAAYGPALGEEPCLEDVLGGLSARMESLYRRWYLRETSAVWERFALGDLASQGYVSDVPRQSGFFVTEVEPILHRARRAWVIVSDALRYEVAAELADRLERTTQGQTHLSSVQAVFPSITSCGMAALLPHASLTFVPRAGEDGPGALDALADGMPTQGTPARERVLQAYLDTYHAGRTARALQANAFTKMGRDERREAVGDAAVVYLYHNRIDAIGDDALTEDDVCSACADAIDELSRLVSLIVREFRATDVLITADHGFQYMAESPAEADKVALSEVRGRVLAYGRRYVVGGPGLSSDSLAPVTLSPVSDTGLCGLAPRECVRVRKAGGGERYVHGGISLQELCVPVLHFRNFRAGSKGFRERTRATLSLVSPLPAITNLSFEVEVLQDEPVGSKTLPATYELQVMDPGGEAVTESRRVRAESREPEAVRRTLRVGLHVREELARAGELRCRLVARALDDDGSVAGETTLAEPVLRVALW